MNYLPRLHKPFIALVLLLVVSLACRGGMPSATPEPTMDIAQSIASTQSAAPVLPIITNTITFTPFPSDTPTTIPTITPLLLPSPLPTSTLAAIVPTLAPAAGACSCAGDTLNCSDFSSHSSAQACYSYCVSVGVGDIHGLDSDGDGDACESLP